MEASMIIYLPSLILSIILTASTMSVYGDLLPLKALPFIILVCLFTFIVMIFTDRYRLAGTLATIILIFSGLTLVRLLALAGSQMSDMSFWQWVLTSGDEAENNLFFTAALILAAGMFFAVTVYYFTVVLYRISFLTLISLMPCILYAKVIADIDNFYLILIAGSNILLHISRAQWNEKYETRNTAIKEPSYIFKNLLTKAPDSLKTIISALVFSLCVLLICAIIPKKEEARYYDRFEDIFLGGDTSSEVSDDYSTLAEFSGNAENYDRVGNRRLFSLYGDAYTYTKSQVFDYYDFEKNRWYYDNKGLDTSYTSAEWRNSRSLLQLGLLQRAIREAKVLNKELIKKYGLDKIAEAPDIEDYPRSLFIRSENFGAVYYLSAPRSIGIVPSGSDSDYGVTDSGMFIRQHGRHPLSFTYRLEFFDQSSGLPAWLSLGASDYSDKDSAAMLNDLVNVLSSGRSSEYNTALGFLSQQLYAIDYDEKTSENTAKIPKKIKDLALDITKDYDSDYLKAYAITEYFRNGSFTYDTGYIAPDKSPEYFLFNSRTGSCSQYATAFTLLARSAGLTVRYAEGFLPEMTSRDGYYTISQRDSHAFPEVFLSNTGWVVFEPTIGGNAAALQDDDSLWGLISKLRIDYGLALVIAAFLAFLVFILIIIWLMIPLFAELIFRSSLYFMPSEKMIVSVYKRLQKKASKNAGLTNIYCLTPNEFKDLLLEYGLDISVISDNFELITWSDHRPDNKYKKNIRQTYIKACRILKHQIISDQTSLS